MDNPNRLDTFHCFFRRNRYRNAKIILFPETCFGELNREDFSEIFGQNIRIIGGKDRVFSSLVYSGVNKSSLISSAPNPKLLLVPIGYGFKIAITRNEKLLTETDGDISLRGVRATKKAFSIIPQKAKELGFKLTDIVLSKGSKDIVSVKDDSVIAEEMHQKASGDPTVDLTYLGFSLGECHLWIDLNMKIIFSSFEKEAGNLIYDAVSGVLEDEAMYRDLDNAFIPKKEDDWTATMNPVTVAGSFGTAGKLSRILSENFSADTDFRPIGSRTVYFSSPGGVWGEISVMESVAVIYFKSTADFDFGIQLLDTLRMVNSGGW